MLRKGLPIILLAATAAEAAEIDHAPVACMLAQSSSEIEAAVKPSGAEARVFFRAGNTPYWSSVPMSGTGERLKAVLPKPAAHAKEVYYYLEAKDASGASRTTEFLAEVVAKKELCPDPTRVAKAVETAAPPAERGPEVALTQPPSESHAGKWLAIGAVAAGAAGATVALAHRSSTPTTIPDGTYTGPLHGYSQNSFTNACGFTLSVPTGGTIAITVSGSTATATFTFPPEVTFTGDTGPGCPAPAVPPLSGTFQNLTVSGVSAAGSLVFSSETLALRSIVTDQGLTGYLSVTGGPAPYPWTAAVVPFQAAKAAN